MKCQDCGHVLTPEEREFRFVANPNTQEIDDVLDVCPMCESVESLIDEERESK